jgi:hypothetical protein
VGAGVLESLPLTGNSASTAGSNPTGWQIKVAGASNTWYVYVLCTGNPQNPD